MPEGEVLRRVTSIPRPRDLVAATVSGVGDAISDVTRAVDRDPGDVVSVAAKVDVRPEAPAVVVRRGRPAGTVVDGGVIQPAVKSALLIPQLPRERRGVLDGGGSKGNSEYPTALGDAGLDMGSPLSN